MAYANTKLSDKENLAKGNQLAKQGKTQKAYDLYFKDIKGNAKFHAWKKRYIRKHKIRTGFKKSSRPSFITKLKPMNAKKVGLLGLDAVLLVAWAATSSSYSKTVKNYNALYSLIDGTSETNQQILLVAKKAADKKATTTTIIGLLTIATIGYTVFDLFIWEEGIFTYQTSLNVRPDKISIAMNMRF